MHPPRHRLARSAFLALAATSLSCTDAGVVTPGGTTPLVAPHASVAALAAPAVRINELHYDDDGTDAGERIEISGPAGMDLTGWSVVLYNGNGGTAYGTRTLSGTVPASCGTRGVVVLAYPSNGIQNGSPDGLALVDAGGSVVEFLSYEGAFTAVGGPADGMQSTDIGVAENGEPDGQSLQRTDGGAGWVGPRAETFDACNGVADPAPVASVVVSPSTTTITVGATQPFTADAFDAADAPIPGAAVVWTSLEPDVATIGNDGVATGVAPGDARIVATAASGAADTATLHVAVAPRSTLPTVYVSELHYDNVGTDADEAVEIAGPAGTDLTGWSVVLYNGNDGAPYGTRTLGGTIPAVCGANGVVALTYPSNGIQNGGPDGLALVDDAGTVVEFLSYEGTFTAVGGPADGMLSTDIGAAESSAPVGTSLQRDAATNTWASGAASVGACNGSGGPPPPSDGSISFSGRRAEDVALPVGFQDQLFATVRDGSGAVVEVPVTWTSETPATGSIDADGVLTALAAGSVTVRATATLPSGVVLTETYTLPTTVATASTTARYEGNTEFGIPTDGTPADDYVVTHPEYTASFSATRNTPNWVSYDLEASHFGGQDRCDCFTYDPALPSSFPRYTTADYTGAGEVAGYGIDRGHLARSFDRTSASLDNAHTFLFSNIIPQASDLNQGPWADMEGDLGDLARFEDREVYIIAGVAGAKGTVKNEGLITIPAQVWKVAVVMRRDHGLQDVSSAGDVQVIAVVMPNEPGVRNVDWHTYQTTVDAVEAVSGYDLLARLPDGIELLVESGVRLPVAVGLVDQLHAAGQIGAGEANSLRSKITNAARQFDAGNVTPAANMLEAALHELDAMERSGRLTGAQAAELRALLSRVVTAAGR
ncbi:MAG TPA: DNA/RNA non-specific endonuclease [Gemmatimonadaceae bacterium]|nr:DNA/RNA non-specific endonuclease [Gemmatimonadaceae bacterium]